MSLQLDDPSVSLQEIIDARIQAAMVELRGPAEPCERPTGHRGGCGWIISPQEIAEVMLNGRCGAQEIVYSGEIRG